MIALVVLVGVLLVFAGSVVCVTSPDGRRGKRQRQVGLVMVLVGVIEIVIAAIAELVV